VNDREFEQALANLKEELDKALDRIKARLQDVADSKDVPLHGTDGYMQ
jgi:hypothetical protein